MPKVQDVQHVRKTANTICSIIFCVNRKMFTNFKGICVFHNTFASKFYPTCCLAVKPCVVDTDPPSLPNFGYLTSIPDTYQPYTQKGPPVKTAHTIRIGPRAHIVCNNVLQIYHCWCLENKLFVFVPQISATFAFSVSPFRNFIGFCAISAKTR